MIKKKTKLTQERLKEILDYDPNTGVFKWRVHRGNRTIGDEAGSLKPNGYRRINIDWKFYAAHRLAWLFMEGYFPEHDIDHRNGIRNDNRISNLREVSKSCNMQNRKIEATNTSGFPGVSWCKQTKKWRAHIRINNKYYHLGNYKDPLDAALARLTEEVNNTHWHCNFRGELVKAIKKAWSGFNSACLA